MTATRREIEATDSRVREMFVRYHPLALEAARRMYPSLDHEAIANEVMTRGWRNLDRINLADAERWFIKATVHSGIDQARQEGRHNARSLDSLPRHLEPSDPTYEPERLTLNTELREIIGQAVNTLPSSRRQIVVLRLFEEATEQETSETTGAALGTVKSGLSRAREDLKGRLVGVRQPEHNLPGLGSVDTSPSISSLEEFILNENTRKLMMIVATRMTGASAKAEDPVQNALVSAWESMHKFRGGNQKAWLLRILVNQVYDAARKDQRRPTSALPAYLEFEDYDQLIDPVKELLGKEVLEAVHRAMNTLPDDQQVCIELCDIQGMSYDEIAQIEETPVGTIKSRLSRGRGRIRDYLKANYPDLVDQFEKFQTAVAKAAVAG